jgi:hypothetical protein
LLKEDGTLTLSDEALDLVGAPDDSDGVEVSNFVLPLYFTAGEEKGGWNDFLGRAYNGETLRSFGVNPGGYVGCFDPENIDHDTFSMKGDSVAGKRLKLKSQAKGARRGIRYQRYATQSRGK